MELCSIASGSSGNCIYVGNESARVLVDAGISKIRIERGLESIGVPGSSIDALLVTHAHADHIQGLGVLVRKYRMPVFATAETLREIRACKTIGKLPDGIFHEISPDHPFYIEDLKICPIRTSHDAGGSVAYRFEDDRSAVAVMTDLGTYDAYIIGNLSNLDALLLESNHDVRMLEVGGYPYPLKQRILSDVGHLSNELCGRLLCEVFSNRMQCVFLGHLSHENNLPELAYETVKLELRYGLGDAVADTLPLYVAKRDEVSRKITV